LKDKFGLVANVVSDHALRAGAKVWILGWNGDAENAQVRGLSKAGRTITKYIKIKRLGNFRAAWIPECRRGDVWATFQWEDKAHVTGLAELMNEKWMGVRFFHRDGRLLRNGLPASSAFAFSLRDRVRVVRQRQQRLRFL
jgi:hypothetical protein